MLNKENYVPWSSLLLQYAKSRPNEKLIHNTIINGPYVRRMIPEPGDLNREVPVNETFHNAVQNQRIQNVRNQNGQIAVLENANQNPNRNGNLVAARAEGNATGHNVNQIRCYNCRGLADLDEIEKVNANSILMANLQQASTTGTQTDKAPVYDSDGSAKDTSRGTSANTKFAKQSIMGKAPKVGETHALSKPVTSNSIPTPQGSKVVKNDKVIAPGMFRINPFKPSREEKHVPNKVRAIVRTNPIIVSQLPVITKKVVNSDSNGLSSTGVDNNKTRRP
nr:hypothetical protein [Tanacetum cinerariifolium]